MLLQLICKLGLNMSLLKKIKLNIKNIKLQIINNVKIKIVVSGKTIYA